MPDPDLRDGVLSRFQSLKIEEYVNPGYQRGAMLAMADGFKKVFYDGYDWVY